MANNSPVKDNKITDISSKYKKLNHVESVNNIINHNTSNIIKSPLGIKMNPVTNTYKSAINELLVQKKSIIEEK